jgi:hypothetical protein
MDIAVKVIPGCSRNEVAGRMDDGTLKVKIAAPPEKGKANAELRAFLAKHFEVPVRNVTILSGETSRRKLVRILK